MNDKFQLISSSLNIYGNHTNYTSSEIIPYIGKTGNSQYIVVPYNNSNFSTSINIKEDTQSLWLSPYDIYEDTTEVSLLDIISGDVKKGDNIFESFKYHFNSDEKEIIQEFSERSTYELSEIFMFIVEFLEEHSQISYKIGTSTEYKNEDVLPENLISLLEVLLDAKINPDRIIEILQNADDVEISALLSANSDKQLSIFRKLEKL